MALLDAWINNVGPTDTSVQLIAIASDIARTKYALYGWAIKYLADNPEKSTLDLIVDTAKDMPIWLSVSLEAQLTAFDLGFMRLIPGIDSAPPLDAQPSVHVSRMAKEWISVDLTMRSVKAKADHEGLPGPVEVPAKVRLENCCADYTRMIEDLRTGTRRLRRPDDDPPSDAAPPHERP